MIGASALTRPLRRPLVGVGPDRAAFRGPDPIVRLFLDGTSGFYYDFTKSPGVLHGLTRAYQDDEGNTPVSASGDAVGQVLDVSQGLVKGAEILTDPEFDNGTTDWGESAGVTYSDGKVIFTSVGSGGIWENNVVTAGTWYIATLVVTSYTAGDLFVRSGGAFGDALGITGPGTYTSIFEAGSANAFFEVIVSGSTTLEMSRVSCQPLAGNHADQDTAGSRLAYTGSGVTGYAAGDGTADHLETRWAPAAATTLAACFRPDAVSDYVMGSRDSATTNSMLGIHSDGAAAAAVGSEDTSTIQIAGDVTGTDVVLLVRYDGSTVQLWKNGVKGYDAAQAGTPTTTEAAFVGAYSNNGTAASWLNGRVYRAFAIQSAIDEDYIVPAMRALGRGIVSF